MNVAVNMERGGQGGTYTALQMEKRSKNGKFDMKKWNMADTG